MNPSSKSPIQQSDSDRSDNKEMVTDRRNRGSTADSKIWVLALDKWKSKILLATLALWAVVFLPVSVLKVGLQQTEDGRMLTAVRKPPTPHANAADAKRLVREFLAADSVEGRVPYVRHPVATLPRMREFYNREPLRPRTVEKFFAKMGIERIDGTDFFWLHTELDDLSVRTAAFEVTADALKLDWESFVNYSEIPWADFLTEEVTGPHDFRVVARAEEYYNFAYTDREKYICVFLTDPDELDHCWGYADRSSVVGQTWSEILHTGDAQETALVEHPDFGTFEFPTKKEKPKHHMILRLRFDEAGKGHKQVLIDSVVSHFWIKSSP